MANELQYSLLTVLHDRAASLLNDAATFTGSPGSAGLLLDLLRNPEISAPALDLGDLLDGFQLSDVFDDVGRLGDGDRVHRFDSRTSPNGVVEQTFEVPGDLSGSLTVSAEVRSAFGQVHRGVGRVHLLEPEGRSVVSDIDDTIKVTEIPAGSAVVLRNTFLRPYLATEGMLARYRGLGDVSFHYVSGGPWQMFGLLHAFLVEEAGFPEGTFHMKSVRKNPLDLAGFVTDVKNLVAGKQYTKEQKIGQISELMRNLPRRTFTLIGDSGELDPEVFSQIKADFPGRVDKIVIRDVVGAKANAPGRLADVDEIIDAPHVERGRSQVA